MNDMAFEQQKLKIQNFESVMNMNYGLKSKPATDRVIKTLVETPKAAKKPKDKEQKWELHKCPKCSDQDLTRKRVGICLNILAKKDLIDKNDLDALKCGKCELGFASKNKYIFFCDACNYMLHPDGDCELAKLHQGKNKK